MKNLVSVFSIFVGVFFSVSGFAKPGDFISMTQIGTASLTEVNQARQTILPGAPGVPQSGVVLYQVTYETRDLQHKPISATGLMIVPDTVSGEYSLMSYQHGTEFNKNGAPSYGGDEAAINALLYGPIGYVVSAADYLGLGNCTGFHPYLHAKSEAWASADMLRAVRQATAKLNIKLNSNLFLTGYSQGGHSTMALHKYLQEKLHHEFKVTASAPMAGPYDLSNTTIKKVLQNPSSSSTAEAAYLIEAMQMVYSHKLKDLMSYSIQPQYLNQVLALLNGINDINAVAAGLPPTPTALLQSSFVNEVVTNSSFPFVQALAKNDLYNWTPHAPVHLYQGDADDEVPFENSLLTYATMKKRGAHIEMTDVGHYTHIQAAIPSFIASSTWFEQIRANSK